LKTEKKNNSNSNSNFKKLISDKEKKKHEYHLMISKTAATVIKKIMKSCIAE